MEVGEIVRRGHGKSLGSVAAIDRQRGVVLVEWRRGNRKNAPRQRLMENLLVIVPLSATDLPAPKFNVNTSPMHIPSVLNDKFAYQPEITRRFYSFQNREWCYYLQDRSQAAAWVNELMLEQANAI